MAKIKFFVKKYNVNSVPFVRAATDDSFLGKIERLSKYIPGTAHQVSLYKETL